MRPSTVYALGVSWLLRSAAPRDVVYRACLTVELINFALSRVEPHRRCESPLVDSACLTPCVCQISHAVQELLRGYTSSSGPSRVYIVSGSCGR